MDKETQKWLAIISISIAVIVILLLLLSGYDLMLLNKIYALDSL